MTKRLQITLEDAEYQQIRSAASAGHMTVAAWVRRALQMALRRDEPAGDVERKLAVIRAAVKIEGPTVDIDQMLAEIEQGYSTGLPE